VRGVSSEHPKTVVPVGNVAPDFDLPVLVGGVKKRLHLNDELARRNIVLAFYPVNWEAVSAQQLIEYQAEREKFAARNAEVVGISVDSIMNTTQWEREIGPFDYSLCSDFWPHGEVSQSFGVFREQAPYAGACERATFVVDRGGKIVFSKVYDLRELPPISETLEALEKL
jgi:peroxiredoxin